MQTAYKKSLWHPIMFVFQEWITVCTVCGDCCGESCENSVKVKDVENEEKWERNIFDIFN